MSTQIIGVLGLVALIILVLLRVPIAVALGAVAVVGYAAVDGWRRALISLGNVPYEMAEKYALTVVPLFVLMGVVAARAGMSRELYRAANAMFSGVRGALAMGTIGACAGFGAICGSSLATTATLSRVAIPEMQRYGYDRRLATGVVASGGTLGILIPPSIILIIYALFSERSVPEMYAAALFPGLALTVLHIVAIAIIARLQPDRLPKVPGVPLRDRVRAVADLWKMALLFAVAVGGIYAGIMSPTEAAAVSAFAAIVIAFATCDFGWRDLMESMMETVWTTGVLFFIAVTAFLFGYFMVITQLPVTVAAFVKGLDVAPWVVILILLVVYVVLGCFLDSLSMIVVTIPVFLPLVQAIYPDNANIAVWFGIVVVVVVEMGLITPPVGMNIFVIRAQMPDIPLATLFGGIGPFLAADMGLILLLLLFPSLALWLPKALGFLT
jgi:tripartite ATP-independent transporter DctM subunit